MDDAKSIDLFNRRLAFRATGSETVSVVVVAVTEPFGAVTEPCGGQVRIALGGPSWDGPPWLTVRRADWPLPWPPRPGDQVIVTVPKVVHAERSEGGG